MSHQSLPATRSILGNPTKRKQEPMWRRESFIRNPVLLLIAAFDWTLNLEFAKKKKKKENRYIFWIFFLKD